MRIVVLPSMIKAVFDALLKNDDPMAATVTYIPDYIKKESNRVKKGEEFVESRRELRELPSSPST